MTRAVLRPVEPADGSPENYCVVCEQRIGFKARQKQWRVICNVYKGKRWDRVEHYHADCYDGRYGEAAA